MISPVHLVLFLQQWLALPSDLVSEQPAPADAHNASTSIKYSNIILLYEVDRIVNSVIALILHISTAEYGYNWEFTGFWEFSTD